MKRKKSEYPKEMFVYNESERFIIKRLVIGKYFQQYITKDPDGCYVGYKNAKDIKKPVEQWEAEDIKTAEDALKYLDYEITVNFFEGSPEVKAIQILIDKLK